MPYRFRQPNFFASDCAARPDIVAASGPAAGAREWKEQK